MHIFRNGFDRPLTPAGINVELARLSRIADLEGTVTTGCFRRLVGRQVFNQCKKYPGSLI
jgi:hypothetical protein